ncbi:MAG: hypothetical protein AAFQ87_12955 [Bacteroidota bacterium]
MKALKALFAVVAIAALTSCGEVCTTCTYTYEVGGQTVEATQPEFCGTRSEVKDLEDAAQEAAEQVATTLGGANATAACVQN